MILWISRHRFELADEGIHWLGEWELLRRVELPGLLEDEQAEFTLNLDFTTEEPSALLFDAHLVEDGAEVWVSPRRFLVAP